jgi:tetratricopeptide (TPR) repeat protein
MGNLDEGKGYFEKSLALHREIGYLGGQPYPISGLGDALMAQGDLAGARKQYEQALALCKELKDEGFSAELEVALASVALAEKRYADGVSLARQATVAFEKSNSNSDEGWSQALLARNLLGAGNLAEAQSAAEKAIALSRQSTVVNWRFEAVLADARVKAKLGKWAEAREELESMIASARRFGYRPYEYQGRLALGEIELWSGSAVAVAGLNALERDARAQGLLLVADQAHALSQVR